MAPKRPDELEYLTGRLSGAVRPPSISLPSGGGKFTTDGCVQIWPGNTFICHIDRASEPYELILEIQEEIKKSPFNRFFAFLPPPSFHMTVFQGVSLNDKAEIAWPKGVPIGLSRDKVSDLMLKRLDGLDLHTSYKIKVDGLFAGHSLTVSGADKTEEAALRQTRVALRDATGITFRDFDDYVFHITVAYLINWLSKKTALELVAFNAEIGYRFKDALNSIELGPVEFCNFDSMHHFEPIRSLA